MPINVGPGSFDRPIPRSLAGSVQPATMEGEYRGQKVAQGPASMTSLIADAAEELAFMHSQEASKRLSERDAETHTGVDERIQRLLEKHGEGLADFEQAGQIEELLESLKQSGAL